MLHLRYSFFCLTFALVIVLAFLKFEAAVYPYTTNLSSLNLNGSEHNIVGNTSSKMATEERLKYTNYIPVILEAGRGASKTYHAQLRNAAFEIVRQTDCFQVVENNTSNAIVVTDATSVNQYPPEQPLIALHTSDAANDLHFLHSPNVLLVLTHIAFVDRNVYQLDRYPLQSSYWYYCSNREQPCRGYTPPSPRKREPVPPIEVIIPQQVPFIRRTDFRMCMTRNQRPLDIVFSGKTTYMNPLIVDHRRQAIAAIQNLSSKGFNTYTSSKRLSRTKYRSLLRRTKLFLSPFGNGEWSSKMYHVIAAGAIPLVPMRECEWEILPRLLGRVPICSVDFQDLEEVVNSVLSNLSFWERNVQSLCRQMADVEGLYEAAKARVNNWCPRLVDRLNDN